MNGGHFEQMFQLFHGVAGVGSVAELAGCRVVLLSSLDLKNDLLFTLFRMYRLVYLEEL